MSRNLAASASSHDRGSATVRAEAAAPPRVTGISFVAARELDRQLGLLGFVACNVDSVRIDSIVVRRTAAGRLDLRFPSKRSGNGQDFQIVRPASEDARVAIERQIFAALKAQGVAA